MRREDRDKLTAQEHADAERVCCAACHAVADAPCVDSEGRPRPPHKVRIKIGRHLAAVESDKARRAGKTPEQIRAEAWALLLRGVGKP